MCLRPPLEFIPFFATVRLPCFFLAFPSPSPPAPLFVFLLLEIQSFNPSLFPGNVETGRIFLLHLSRRYRSALFDRMTLFVPFSLDDSSSPSFPATPSLCISHVLAGLLLANVLWAGLRKPIFFLPQTLFFLSSVAVPFPSPYSERFSFPVKSHFFSALPGSLFFALRMARLFFQFHYHCVLSPASFFTSDPSQSPR